MEKVRRVCWDSSCFVAILRNEAPHAEELKKIVQDAESGNLKIVVSTMAITEVVRPAKSTAPFDRAKFESLLRDMFGAPYVTVASHSKFVAELGRAFVWANPGLHPHDSIHVATAVFAECEALETADAKLIKLDGKCDKMAIRHPKFIGQQLITGDKANENAQGG